MQYVPQYLKDHVIENITSYEVQSAPVGGFVISCKAMTDEEITMRGLAKPSVAGKMYPVEMANTITDRHRERFTVEVLQKYAADINANGASMNFGHSSMILIGSVLKGSASVENGILKGVVFIDDLATMPNQPGMTVNHAIKAGTVSDVSVEVSGTLRVAERDTEGYAEVWEYYIDPERPGRTEFHGLALVMRGAQIGAALSVKSMGGKAAPVNNPNPKKMKEVFFVNGKKHVLTGAAKDGEFAFDAESLKGLETAITDLEKVAADAVAEVSRLKGLETENAALRAPYEADIANFQKALETPSAEALTADAIKALGTAELVAKANALRTQVDNGGKSQDSKKEAPATFTNPYL